MDPFEFTPDDMLGFAQYVYAPEGYLPLQRAIDALQAWRKQRGIRITYKGRDLTILEDIKTDGNGIARIAVQLPGRMI